LFKEWPCLLSLNVRTFQTNVKPSGRCKC